MSMEIGGIDRNLDLARRFRFEAYFRDDETEKRVFGVLEPGKNPFAGYYAYAGKDDDRYAHLVINDEGRFWIYHSLLHAWQGTGGPAATGAFEGVGEAAWTAGPHGHPEPHRTAAPGRRILSARGEQRRHAAAAPARPNEEGRSADGFRGLPSSSDEVHFAGVFSATYGEKNERLLADARSGSGNRAANGGDSICATTTRAAPSGIHLDGEDRPDVLGAVQGAVVQDEPRAGELSLACPPTSSRLRSGADPNR